VGSVVLLALAGCGFDESARPSTGTAIAIEGLYPDFDPAESRYVSRCGRGGAAPIRAETLGGAQIEVGSSPPGDGVMPVRSQAALLLL
jgi:hypothetical protein